MINKFSAITDSINLYSIETKKFKTGILAFNVTMPKSRYLSPYTLILTKMFEKATKSYPKRIDLSRRADELYVASTDIRRIGFGKNMILSVSVEMLDEKYCQNGPVVTKNVCELLKEYILSPLFDDEGNFPEKSFESAKRYSLDLLKATINNPGRYASLRISELLRRDDPDSLSFEETIEAVEKCDRFTLTKFYLENGATRPIDVYYVGSLSHENLADKLRLVLGDHHATVKDSFIALGDTTTPREVVRKDETMSLTQGRLALGFRCGIYIGDDDYYAALLFDELFGASASSKLFLNVREKLSLCYSCGSSYTSTTGNVMASAGISPKNREVTESAILNELENIKAGRITKKEFSSAKKALLNSIREAYDNPCDILEHYLFTNMGGIKLSLDGYLKRISLLTKEDVIRVANATTLDCVYFLCGNKETEAKGE